MLLPPGAGEGEGCVLLRHEESVPLNDVELGSQLSELFPLIGDSISQVRPPYPTSHSHCPFAHWPFGAQLSPAHTLTAHDAPPHGAGHWQTPPEEHVPDPQPDGQRLTHCACPDIKSFLDCEQSGQANPDWHWHRPAVQMPWPHVEESVHAAYPTMYEEQLAPSRVRSWAMSRVQKGQMTRGEQTQRLETQAPPP